VFAGRELPSKILHAIGKVNFQHSRSSPFGVFPEILRYPMRLPGGGKKKLSHLGRRSIISPDHPYQVVGEVTFISRIVLVEEKLRQKGFLSTSRAEGTCSTRNCLSVLLSSKGRPRAPSPKKAVLPVFPTLLLEKN